MMIRGQNGISLDWWGPLGALEHIIQKFDLLGLLESCDIVWLLTLSSRIPITLVLLCGLEQGVPCTGWYKPQARAQRLWSGVQAGFQPPVSILGGHLYVVSNLHCYTGWLSSLYRKYMKCSCSVDFGKSQCMRQYQVHQQKVFWLAN